MAGFPPLLAVHARTNEAELRSSFLSIIRKCKTKFLSVLLLAFLLGACTADPLTIKRIPRQPSTEEGQVAETEREQEPDGEQGEDEELPAEISEAIEKPKQEPALEIDLTNFKERLLGLDADEISELLGSPNFERAEPPAKIWQYRSSLCIVDIFLFDDEGDLTVDHVDVRGRKVETVDEKECFASILKAVHEGPEEEPQEDLGPIAPEEDVPEDVPEEDPDEDVSPEQPAPDAQKVPEVEKEDFGDDGPPPEDEPGPSDQDEGEEPPAFGDDPEEEPDGKDGDEEPPAFGDDPEEGPEEEPDTDFNQEDPAEPDAKTEPELKPELELEPEPEPESQPDAESDQKSVPEVDDEEEAPEQEVPLKKDQEQPERDKEVQPEAPSEPVEPDSPPAPEPAAPKPAAPPVDQKDEGEDDLEDSLDDDGPPPTQLPEEPGNKPADDATPAIENTPEKTPEPPVGDTDPEEAGDDLLEN